VVRDALEANAETPPPERSVPRAGWVRSISILVSLVTIILIGVLGWRSLAAYRALHGEVEHTQQVLLDLERLGSALKDAEAGQRGFVISGDPTFLVPYEEAAEQTPRSSVSCARKHGTTRPNSSD
jgi:CHASE3 domain sensor protein